MQTLHDAILIRGFFPQLEAEMYKTELDELPEEQIQKLDATEMGPRTRQ